MQEDLPTGGDTIPWAGDLGLYEWNKWAEHYYAQINP